MHYAICDTSNDVDFKQIYVTELERLLDADENDIVTSLLIFIQGSEMFDDYLDLLDWFQKLLEQADLIEHLQLASFHPRYQFERVPADDLSQFTNRARHPIIHILRQAHLSRALAYVAEPERIYAENIKKLNKLGRQKV